MAIQMRRGLYSDFDPTKMLPGEWAVAIDSDTNKQVVWMCFAPGVVKRMGTYEDFKQQIADATGDIKNEYIAEFQAILEQIEALAEQTSTNTDTVIQIRDDTVNTYLPQMLEYLNGTAQNAQTATEKANEASDYALQSQSYAVGGTGTRNGEDSDNAKHYYEQSKEIYKNFSSAGSITGVKGDAETTYRTGQVNLTAENIGALPISSVDSELSSESTNPVQNKVVTNELQDMQDIALAESLGWMRCPVAQYVNYYTEVPIKSNGYYYLVKLNNGAIYRLGVKTEKVYVTDGLEYVTHFDKNKSSLIIGTDVGISNEINNSITGIRVFYIKDDEGTIAYYHGNCIACSSSPDIVSWYCEIPIDGNGTVKDMISQSTAITEKGQYALDAIEKNASVEGTLANLLGTLTTQHNSLATDVGDTKWHLSNTSYKDTVGTLTTNGIHGTLDAKIHASISTLSSGIYSFSNSGPMYHVLLFKYTDNYYSGLCFGYDTSRLVLFKYVDNGTSKTFYTRYV